MTRAPGLCWRKRLPLSQRAAGPEGVCRADTGEGRQMVMMIGPVK
jgi:hypothetical protein